MRTCLDGPTHTDVERVLFSYCGVWNQAIQRGLILAVVGRLFRGHWGLMSNCAIS
jgi:hypothetical protein